MAENQFSGPLTFQLLPGTKLMIHKESHLSALTRESNADKRKSETRTPQFITIDRLKTGNCLALLGQERASIGKISIASYHGPIHHVSAPDPSNSFRLLPFQRILIPRRVQSLSDSGAWSSVPHNHFQQARHLRRHMTPPEVRLWQYLRAEQLGIKFRNQHPLGPFIADFYARQAGLVVEVDGGQAHGSPDQRQYDQMRDEWMASRGLRVRRYSASEIFSNITGVVEDIQYWCGESVLKAYPNYQWCYAESLKVKDMFIGGTGPEIFTIQSIEVEHINCRVYHLELDGSAGILSRYCILG